MRRILPLSEVQNRLPELLTGIEEREEEIVITKDGRPAAILLNVYEFTGLKEALDVVSDPGLMKQIGQSKEFYAQGRKGLSFEDVFGEQLRPRRKH
jgi:prevent-host-death family protein